MRRIRYRAVCKEFRTTLQLIKDRKKEERRRVRARARGEGEEGLMADRRREVHLQLLGVVAERRRVARRLIRRTERRAARLAEGIRVLEERRREENRLAEEESVRAAKQAEAEAREKERTAEIIPVRTFRPFASFVVGVGC